MMDWLYQCPEENGFYYISPARPYKHDESKYDQQYRIDPNDLLEGQGLVSLLRDSGMDFSGPALELGCGTGRLSLGLVKEEAFPYIMLTDPSTAFLEITREKIHALDEIEPERVIYATLSGEEIHRIPAESLSLIAMSATLHHIIDIPRFIHEAAAVLRPNGALAFYEPCLEAYFIMGALAQFLPLAVKDAGITLTEEQQTKIQSFINAMHWYTRKDIDKSRAEDKHVFRVDEVMKYGSDAGLKVEFFPNISFRQFTIPKEKWVQRFSFINFYRNYLRNCMSFEEELIDYFEKYFRPHLQFLEMVSQTGNPPYASGVFICRKR